MGMRVLSVMLVASLAGLALAQDQSEPRQERRDWGISVGAYFPVDDDIRDQFGDALLRFGLSPTTRKFGRKTQITTDVNVLWAKKNDSKLILVPVTAGLRISLGNEEDVDGYVSVNAGPAYYDYRLFRLVPAEGSTLQSYRDSGIMWNFNIEGGALIDRRLAIIGRYDLYQKKDGFDFSGFSLSVNLALFKW